MEDFIFLLLIIGLVMFIYFICHNTVSMYLHTIKIHYRIYGRKNSIA